MGCALLVLGLCLATLAACAPHSGGDEVAFLRDGRLWTVNDDGSDALAIAAGNVVGFAWSPDHHQLVFRYGGGAPPPPSPGAAAPDAPGDLGVVGVDGGGVVTITPGVPGLARSDAWWDAGGNRLVYREGFPPAPGQEPTVVDYVVSQSDQPSGIARRLLLDAAALPAVAPDGSQVAVVDPAGDLRLGAPGATGRVLAAGAALTLPGGDRPARVLWQPGHQALLFVGPGPGRAPWLLLAGLDGRTRPLLPATGLLDFAFSPDGSQLLAQRPGALEVWAVGAAAGGKPAFAWPEGDADALTWWSPDSRFVLVRDAAGLRLADVRGRTVRQLLAAAGAAPAPAHPSWRPLGASPWSADGRRIVFADPGTGTWLGRRLPRGDGGGGGLYVATVAGGAGPALIAGGGVAWPSWGALDPGASWLVAS